MNKMADIGSLANSLPGLFDIEIPERNGNEVGSLGFQTYQ